jgi:hypothetical protein
MSLAVGFRVKSGYAIAVTLSGPAKSPAAVARRMVELCDPDQADTRQPFHHDFYTHEEDRRELTRRMRIVRRCAKHSVDRLIGEMRAAGFARSVRAALVVGSVIDPKQVANPHIRAHASEGQLFRTVLEDALNAHGIACDVIVEKQLAARAVSDLKRRDADIRSAVAAFGKALGGPWRAEEKAASAAAWIALAGA